VSSRSEDDPATLAESARRSGRPAEAERIARRHLDADPGSLRARVALALALLDQRRVDAAHIELVQGLDASGELTEGELEDAFEAAEPDADQLVDANRVAEQALQEAELGPTDEIAPQGPFATRTMAELLERQGDREGAARIRSKLEPARRAAPSPASERRRSVVRELERWLSNLGGAR
jgi:hypothetical protein